MIRILHVLGRLDLGGAETLVMNIYRAIDKNNIQFDFVKHVSKKGDYEDEILSLGGRIFECPKYKGFNHLKYAKWWNDFFTQHPEYHIIHGHVRSTASVYLSIANNHQRTTISHSHNTSNGKGLSAVVKYVMQKKIRNIARFYFACSIDAGEWLFGKELTTSPNFYLIPNGIDIEKFSYNEDIRISVRKQLGVAKDEYLIGYVGRFTEQKNQSFLIQLFSEHVLFHPNSRLLLVGDGEQFDYIKSLCEELKLTDKVLLPGGKHNIEDYYQAMDVFVFPSLWEGLGIVLIEAQANGLPCIVSDRIPQEAILHETVQVLPLEDMQAWERALHDCANNRERKAVDPKIQMYDIKSVTKKLTDFYTEQQNRKVVKSTHD